MASRALVLVAGLAIINAAGVYAQLVAAHVDESGAAQSAIEKQEAALAARIDVAAHAVADLDRRLGQIDGAVEKAAKRGRTNAAAQLTINDGTVLFIYERYQQLQGTRYYVLALRRC